MKGDEKKEVSSGPQDEQSNAVIDSDRDVQPTSEGNGVRHVSNKLQKTEQQKSRVQRAKRVFILSLLITAIFAVLSLIAFAVFVYFFAPTTMGVAIAASIGISSAVFIFASIFIAFYISFEIRGVKEEIEEFQHELQGELLEESRHGKANADLSAPNESVAVAEVEGNVSQVLPTRDVAEGGQDARSDGEQELQNNSASDNNDDTVVGGVRSVRSSQRQRIDKAGTVGAAVSADNESHDVRGTTDEGARDSEQSERNTKNKTSSQKVIAKARNVTFGPDTIIPQSETLSSANASGENVGTGPASSSFASDVVPQKTDVQALQLDMAETAASVAMRRDEENKTCKQIHVSDEFLRVHVPEKGTAVEGAPSNVRAYVRINTDNTAVPADKTKLKEILSRDVTHNLSYKYNKRQNKFYVVVKELRFEVDNITIFSMGREPTDSEISELRQSLSGKEQVFIELIYSSPCISKKGDLGLYETTRYTKGECTAEILEQGVIDAQQAYSSIYLTLMSYTEFQEKPWKLQHARQFISFCREEMFSSNASDIGIRRYIASMIVNSEMAFQKISQRNELPLNDRNLIKAILDNAKKLKNAHYDESAVEKANIRLCLMHSMFSRGDEVFKKPFYDRQVVHPVYEFIGNSRFREAVSLLAMQAVYDKIVANPDVKITHDDFPYICTTIPGLTDVAFYFMRACLHPTKTYDVLDDHMMSLCTIREFQQTNTGKLCTTQKAALLLEEKDGADDLISGEQEFAFDVLSNRRVRVHTPGNIEIHKSRDEVIDRVRRHNVKESRLDIDSVFSYINSDLSDIGREAAIAESFAGVVKSILNGKYKFPIVSGKCMGAEHHDTVTGAINTLLMKGDSERFKSLLHYNPYLVPSFVPLVGVSNGVLLSPEYDAKPGWWTSLFKIGNFSLTTGKQQGTSPGSIKSVNARVGIPGIAKSAIVDSSDSIKESNAVSKVHADGVEESSNTNRDNTIASTPGATPAVVGSVSPNKEGFVSNDRNIACVGADGGDSSKRVNTRARTSNTTKSVAVDSVNPKKGDLLPAANGMEQYCPSSENGNPYSYSAQTVAVRTSSSNRPRGTFTIYRVAPYEPPKDVVSYASDHQLIENHTEFTLFIQTRDTNIRHINVHYPVQKVSDIPMAITFSSGGFIKNKSLCCTVGDSSINVSPDGDGFCMVLAKGDPRVSYYDVNTNSEGKTVMFRFYADIDADLVNIPSNREVGIKPKLIPLADKGRVKNGKCALGINAVDTPATREVLLSEMARFTPFMGSYEDGYRFQKWSNDMIAVYSIYHNTIAKDGVSLQAVADSTTHGNKFFAFIEYEKAEGAVLECFSSIGRYKKKHKNAAVGQGTPLSLLALAYSMFRTGGNGVYANKAVIGAKSDGKLLVKFLSDDKFRNLVISAVFSHVLRERHEYVKSKSPLANEQFPLLFRQIPGLTSCVKAMVNVVFPPKGRFNGGTDFLYPIVLIDQDLARKTFYGKDIDKLAGFIREVDNIAGAQPIAVFAFFLNIAAKNVASDDKLESVKMDYKALPFECESLEVLKRYVSYCEKGDIDSIIKVMESSYDVLMRSDASKDLCSESESTRSNSVTLGVLKEMMTYAIVKYTLGRFKPRTDLGMKKNMCDFLSSSTPFSDYLDKDVACFVASEDFATTSLFTEHFPEKIGVTLTVAPPYFCTTVMTLCPPEKKEDKAIITEAPVLSEGVPQERSR